MFELATPHPRFHRSFLAATDEFLAAGEEPYAGIPNLPADRQFGGLSLTRAEMDDPGTFARYATWLAGLREPDAPRPENYVPSTVRWMADGDEYLGQISVRHELTELLLTWGGHIGYSVRPSARRRGIATAALRMILPTCAELGIDPVLVTCDPDNVGSRRAIERNGGVYEDTRSGKRRYWVPANVGAPTVADAPA